MNCPICGNPVPPSKGNRPRKYCSYKCSLKAAGRAFWKRKRNQRDCERIASKIRERIKDDSVRVEIRDGKIIETRGQVCIGARAASHLTHN